MSVPAQGDFTEEEDDREPCDAGRALYRPYWAASGSTVLAGEAPPYPQHRPHHPTYGASC